METTAVISASMTAVSKFKKLGYSLTLTFSHDVLECTASYEPSEKGDPLSMTDLSAYLTEVGVREGLLDDGISAIMTAASARKHLSKVPVARGVPVTPGEDGRIELTIPENRDNGGSVDAESAKVDFRNVQQFINVTKGDLIARIIPPTGGIAGKTVKGAAIPPVPGKTFVVKLGANVSLAESDSVVVADSDGRVCLIGKEISVENVYQVKGDVNFKVGNISFNGVVDISGDVLDGFVVHATKGIRVGGNIEACTITSEGDVSFCGMSGQGRGSIKAAGSIFAKFIHDTDIECDGNLVCDVELRSCNIRCLGSVMASKGVIAGGECIAQGGIDAGTIGSPSSIKTRVVSGINYIDKEEMHALFAELKAFVEKESGTIKGLAEQKIFMEKRAQLMLKIHETKSRFHEEANPKLNIRKKVYEGTLITIGSQSQEIREALNGPISLIENSIGGGLISLNLTELTINGRNLANEIARVAKMNAEMQAEVGE